MKNRWTNKYPDRQDSETARQGDRQADASIGYTKTIVSFTGNHHSAVITPVKNTMTMIPEILYPSLGNIYT